MTLVRLVPCLNQPPPLLLLHPHPLVLQILPSTTMARLSRALCLMLASSALLLLVLLLAASPASGDEIKRLRCNDDCVQATAACIRRACKCGWSIWYAAARCSPEAMWAYRLTAKRDNEGERRGRDGDDGNDDDDRDLECPRGMAVKAGERVIDIQNICRITHMVRRTRFPERIRDSLHFNHRGCHNYMADLCRVRRLFDLGLTSIPMNRRLGSNRDLLIDIDIHPLCRTCKSLAHLMATLICSGNLDLCPVGNNTSYIPNFTTRDELFRQRELVTISGEDTTLIKFFDPQPIEAINIDFLNGNCYEQPPCISDWRQVEQVTKSLDVVGGGK